MQATVILIGIVIVAAIAVVFFGVMGNGNAKQSSITDVLGTETFFKDAKMNNPKGRCVIYVSTVYEKLRISAQNDEISRAADYTRKRILALCAGGRGKAARVDGNNYVVAAVCGIDDTEKFCKHFLNDDMRLAEDIDASVGVYLADDEAEFKTVAGYAKKISRQAKNLDEKYCICNKKTLSEVVEKDNIEKNIDSLIDNDEFYLMFQPFVDARTEKIIGCEALIRLQRNRGSIMPDNFLDIIHREKLNLKFDLYVYRKCCVWAKKHGGRKLHITCNFSRSTLSCEKLPQYLVQINNEVGLDYSAVAIEITEDSVAPDFEQLKSNVIELKSNGFGICLDDFGKAFTSLGDISRLSPNVVKIDKTMLYDAEDKQGLMVFENVVQLAKKMNSTVLCEGIETDRQKSLAVRSGCDILQGFYFYKPLPEDEFDNLINKAQ